jgi:hypothetical protein
MLDWDLVSDRIDEAKAIAWDTCHKIYLLMDDAQVEKMREYEYDPLITYNEMTNSEMFDTVKKWYEESCGLRFIEAVSTMPEGEDANLGFETLVGQFEDEECEDCGEEGCQGVCNDYDDEEDEDEDEE